MESYLGIDIGTSAVKVGLMGVEGGSTVCSARVAEAELALSTGEIDPEAWWAALGEALAALREVASLAEVVAIALIGNTPTLVLVDGEGAPVGRALLWSDTQAGEEARELLAERTQAEWDDLYGGYLPVSAASSREFLLAWRWLSTGWGPAPPWRWRRTP